MHYKITAFLRIPLNGVLAGDIICASNSTQNNYTVVKHAEELITQRHLTTIYKDTNNLKYPFFE